MPTEAKLVIKRIIDSGEETYTVSDIPKNLANDVMFAQSAVNGVALMNAMVNAIKTLKEKHPAHGGDWYNQHPIITMYLNQLSHLNFGVTLDHPQMTLIWSMVEAAQNGQ